MQIPKFKEFFVEQDLERKGKPITFALITIALGGTLIINWIVNLFMPGLN